MNLDEMLAELAQVRDRVLGELLVRERDLCAELDRLRAAIRKTRGDVRVSVPNPPRPYVRNDGLRARILQCVGAAGDNGVMIREILAVGAGNRATTQVAVSLMKRQGVLSVRGEKGAYRYVLAKQEAAE